MAPSILPPAPADSVLAEWAAEGVRREPSHSNVVTFISPGETYALTVEVDDPIHGYLIRLSRLDDAETRIGQTVVEDRDDALTVAANMVAAADDLATLEDRPILGPETVHQEDVEREATQPPEEWREDAEDWNDRLQEAYEKAEVPRSKGTLTTKEIDGQEYYYLQWREGDTVTSQYVAPASPSE
jgi:hypothetical protein